VITFKSTEDIAKLSPTDPAYPTVQDLVDRLITEYTAPGQPYDHEAYGYVILIQEGDTDGELDEIWDGCRLVDIYWEGISKQGDFFVGIYLANNEYGLCFVIPDAPWVNGELRSLIEDILDPLPETLSINPKEYTHEEI